VTDAPPADESDAGKEPFDIDRVMILVRDSVAPYPPAAMFQLADEGYSSLFEAVLSCIISIRTLDEDTLVVSRRLFARARTPQAVYALSEAEIVQLLRGSTFPEPKATQIREIARRALEAGGALAPNLESLLALPGVGPKCANLALGVGGNGANPDVPVDVHVHRVTNRWGYVATRTPEATMAALGETLPTQYRLEINRLLVPFGKHICLGVRPRCYACPVVSMCRQIGVTPARAPSEPEVKRPLRAPE